MLQLNETISPKDHMVTADMPGYFRTSLSGLKCIQDGLRAAGRDEGTIRRILDFGSGYGRVYRALAAGFPQAELTAADLMGDAAMFCAETFGGKWIQSHEDVHEVKLPEKYDLIWLGSVYTHLPAHRWVTLTRFLRDALEPNGIVVFTTHGQRAITHIEQVVMKRNAYLISQARYELMKQTLEITGFDFVPSLGGNLKRQREIGMNVSENEYGFSFAAEWWVRRVIDHIEGIELVHYAAPGWAGNHDAVTFRRAV